MNPNIQIAVLIQVGDAEGEMKGFSIIEGDEMMLSNTVQKYLPFDLYFSEVFFLNPEE